MPWLAWLGLEWRGRCGRLRSLLWFMWEAAVLQGWKVQLRTHRGLARMGGQAAAVCADTLITSQKPCASGCQPSAASRASGWIGVCVDPSEAGRNPLGRRRLVLWWEQGRLNHYHKAFDCGAPLQMSSVWDRHFQRLSQHLQSVPVMFILPSFYVLPSNPCSQPVCVIDTGVLPNFQGRNLTTISNFVVAPSYSCCLIRKEGKISTKELGQMLSQLWPWKPAHVLGCCGHQARELSTDMAPWYCCSWPLQEMQLLQCHWVKAAPIEQILLLSSQNITAAKSCSVDAACISWTAAKSNKIKK